MQTRTQLSIIGCRGMTALLAVVLACGSRVPSYQAHPGAGGVLQLEIGRSGRSELVFQKAGEEGPDHWESLTLFNQGPRRIRDVRLSSPHGSSFFDVGPQIRNEFSGGEDGFALLPGERIACTMIPGGMDLEGYQAVLLRGLLVWEGPPADAGDLGGWLRFHREARIAEAGGLQLGGAEGRPGLIDIQLEAPLTVDQASVAWECTGGSSPEVWVCLNGVAWGKMSPGRQRVDWAHPLDLSRSVRGARNFRLRLVGGGSPDGPIQIRRIRIKREFQADGLHWDGWGRLPQRMMLAYDAPSSPTMSWVRVELMSGGEAD